MIRVVMDTSSLVSLEIVGLLRRALKVIQITIPEAVVEELKEIGKFPDSKGKAATNVLGLVSKRKISAVKLKSRKKVDGLLSSGVDEGEASCFVCCVENGIGNLVMDDVDAAYELEGHALAREIKLKISAAVIVELVRRGVISKKKSTAAMKKMIKLRGWEGGVLEVLVKKYLD